MLVVLPLIRTENNHLRSKYKAIITRQTQCNNLLLRWDRQAIDAYARPAAHLSVRIVRDTLPIPGLKTHRLPLPAKKKDTVLIIQSIKGFCSHTLN